MTAKKERKPRTLTKRSPALLLTEEETSRFLSLIASDRKTYNNTAIAKLTGTKFANVVAGWIASKKLPAKCRALLELWELKDKIKV